MFRSCKASRSSATCSWLVRKFGEKPQLDRFLCGHDEREWFVAAVPGGASSVRQAMDSLQPKDVREALTRHHVSSRKRYARKNRAFRRQGEWFFVPEPSFVVDEKLVLRNEPLRRGSGQAAPRGATLPHGRRDGSRVQPPSERRQPGRSIARSCSAIPTQPAGAGR